MNIRNLTTKNWIRAILLVFLSFLFLFSALSKLLDITLFEVTLYASGIPLKYTELLSRIIVISELCIAILLVFSVGKKDRLMLLFAFVFFSIFDLSLLYDIIAQGGKENCGCFGDIITMSSETALIKNIGIQILMIPFLLFSIQKKRLHWLFYLMTLVCVSVGVMLIFPINMVTNDKDEKQIQARPLSQTELVELEDSLFSILRDKEQFLIFVHPKCKHCKKFTKKLNKYRDQNMLPETTLLMYGAKERIDTFNSATENALPTTLIPKNTHLKTCKGVFPSVFYIKKDTLFGPILARRFDPEKTILSLADDS